MAESDPRPPQTPTAPRLSHLAILLLLAGLLFLTGLGNLGLTDRDEGSNAEAAREMLESGDFVSPTLNYEPRFAKPALTYWVISGTYWLLGVNEFSARLPSAIFGIALILVHYLFLTRVCGATVGFFGTLMLLLNLEIVAISRLVLTDSILIFFTTVATYSFWLGIHGEGRARHFFWLLYIGMALAMLTKGPIGILIPLLAIIPYLTLTRQWGRYWTHGFPLAGGCLFLLVASPWYVTMFAVHGAEYAASAQANTLGRFMNVIGGHGGTFLFYFPILLFGFFPWSGFLPVALYQALKDWRAYWSRDRIPAQEQSLALFAGLWAVGIFLFFSLSATRLPHYIGPLFPAVAILTAMYWSRCVKEPSTPGLHASLRTMLVLGYVLGLGLAFTPAIYEAFAETIAREFPAATKIGAGLSPVVTGVVLLIGALITRYFGLTADRRVWAVGAACAMITVVMLIIIHISLPRFNKYFVAPPQALATIAGYNLGPNDRLIQYGRRRPSLVFYAKRKVLHVSPGKEKKFESYLAPSGRTMIILQAHLRSRLPLPVSEFPVVLERYGYALLSSKPLIQ